MPIELCVYVVRLEVTQEMTFSKLDSRIRNHRDSIEFARAFLYNKLSIGRQVDISTRINRGKQRSEQAQHVSPEPMSLVRAVRSAK